MATTKPGKQAGKQPITDQTVAALPGGGGLTGFEDLTDEELFADTGGFGPKGSRFAPGGRELLEQERRRRRLKQLQTDKPGLAATILTSGFGLGPVNDEDNIFRPTLLAG